MNFYAWNGIWVKDQPGTRQGSTHRGREAGEVSGRKKIVTEWKQIWWYKMLSMFLLQLNSWPSHYKTTKHLNFCHLHPDAEWMQWWILQKEVRWPTPLQGWRFQLWKGFLCSRADGKFFFLLIGTLDPGSVPGHNKIFHSCDKRSPSFPVQSRFCHQLFFQLARNYCRIRKTCNMHWFHSVGILIGTWTAKKRFHGNQIH